MHNYRKFTQKLFILGVGETNNERLTIQEALKDDARIEYYHGHLLALQSAIRSIRAPGLYTVTL
jgi:beta-glucosidase